MVTGINDSFANAVNEIHNCVGRIIITGVGKSAIIAQKIVATFNSTGTPSVFMHAADAVHGDLGIIQKEDTIICISKSGNTTEIRLLIPFIKNNANKIISICGNAESYLANQSDIFLNTFVDKEACPHNLAPTTSTTAQLAMGDALAVATLEVRNFTKQDFARYHPGGTLGKQLILKVFDVILKSEKPEVTPNTSIKNVLFEISKKRLGATAVIDNNNICGIITDGDIRRMLEKYSDISNIVEINLTS
jgi:arabinose-5-phosphate isomerase